MLRLLRLILRLFRFRGRVEEAERPLYPTDRFTEDMQPRK